MIPDRVRVVLSSVVTWLTLASAAVLIFSEEIAAVLPEGPAADLGEWALRVVAWLGAAVAIIRRVTPVPESERGLLPPEA